MNTFKNEQNNTDDIPYMKSLSTCINRMVLDGYTADFKVVESKLQAIPGQKSYKPTEITVKNFFRFEGQSDPDDNTILYVIETNDGLKGTLADAYGVYANEDITEFFKEVDAFSKKITND